MVLPGSGGQAGRRVDPAPTDDMTVLQVRPWSLVLSVYLSLPFRGRTLEVVPAARDQRAQRAQRPATVCLRGRCHARSGNVGSGTHSLLAGLPARLVQLHAEGRRLTQPFPLPDHCTHHPLPQHNSLRAPCAAAAASRL